MITYQNFCYNIYYKHIDQLGIIKTMEVQQPQKIVWAKSTESKLTTFLDEYLINYPQSSVRQSTKKLLFSLYKKGTQQQQIQLLQIVRDRVQQLSNMGKSSEEFLKLIELIFQHSGGAMQSQKRKIVVRLLQVWERVFEDLCMSRSYSFYSFCANMVQFEGGFKPYLLEVNGCLKCFGKITCEFELCRYEDVVDQYRIHLTSIEFVLKRKYEIRDLKFTITPRNFRIPYRYVNVLYLDEDGSKKHLAKCLKNEPLPPLSLRTSSIFLEFHLEVEEDFRSRRRGINCWICGRTDEESCRNCRGAIDFEGHFKALTVDPAKLNLELSQASKKLAEQHKALENFYSSLQNNKPIKTLKHINIPEIEETYKKLMQNVYLLSKNKNATQLQCQQLSYCFSCNYYQTYNIINFIRTIVISRSLLFTQQQMYSLKQKLQKYLQINQIESIKTAIIDIISALYILLPKIHLENQFGSANSHPIPILSNIMLYQKEIQRKEEQQSKQISNFNWEQLQKFISTQKFYQNLQNTQRVQLFVCYMIPWDYIAYLKNQYLTSNDLANISRLTIAEVDPIRNLIDFPLQDLYKQTINNYIKLLFKLLPISLVPISSLTIKNPQYLEYVNVKAPEIDIQNVKKNVIMFPEPILRLNYFQILPHLIKKLDVEDGLEVIIELCKFRSIWNPNLEETFSNFCQILSNVEKDKQLLMCLEGYDKTEQFSFLKRVYQLLVPQRMKFLIRIDIPNHIDQTLEYPIIPVRQVKSDDLEGDRIEDLRIWIQKEFKRVDKDMYFNLIIENQIIQNLTKPIQVVYKKLVQKQVKKQIGKNSFYYLRVLYGVQALYQGNQKAATLEVADQKLNQCIQCSSYLFQKVSPKSNKLGFQLFMKIIGKLKKQQLQKREMCFKILNVIFNNTAVRKKIVEEQYGQTLINQTMKALSFSNQKETERSALLLDVCSKIIDEATLSMMNLRKNSTSQRKQSEMIDQSETNYDSENAVNHILALIKQCQANSKKTIIEDLIKLLPFSSKDQKKSSIIILEYLDVQKLIDGKYSARTREVSVFFDTLQQGYKCIKQLLWQNGLSKKILQNMINHTMTNGNPDDQKVTNKVDLIQINLAILKGLLKGNQPLQYQILNMNLLKVFEHLQKTKINCKNKIKTYCFEICQYFSKGKLVIKDIKQIFQAKALKTKKEGVNKKNNLFQKMKEKSQKAKKILLANENFEEEQIICVRCKQGYNSRKEIMGLYIYSTDIQIIALDTWWKQSKKCLSPSCITYFTIIHYQCHREAAEIDRNNRVKIQQWTGAQLRNSQAKCNNWIPFKGAKTTDEEFDRVLIKYFEKNKNGNFWNVLNDLNGLIYRLSIQYNFGKQGHGSSYVHNIKLIPVLLAFTCHLMKKNQNIKFIKEGFQYFKDHKIKKPSTFRLYVIVCLFTLNFKAYQHIKPRIWQAIQLLYGDKDQAMDEKKPDLVFMMIVAKIFELIHKNCSETSIQPIHLQIDRYIADNFSQLVKGFEKMADEYRVVILKCENTEQFKQLF